MSVFPVGLLSSSSSGLSSSSWVLNSRASYHMSPSLSSFALLFKSLVLVVIADGILIPIVWIGFVDTHCLSLNDIYHIPNRTLNIIFISQLCKSRYLVSVSSSTCYVQDPQS